MLHGDAQPGGRMLCHGGTIFSRDLSSSQRHVVMLSRLLELEVGSNIGVVVEAHVATEHVIAQPKMARKGFTFSGSELNRLSLHLYHVPLERALQSAISHLAWILEYCTASSPYL